MADIIAKIAAIRAAIFGKDVRENIASGIESINAEVINTTTRQGTIEGKQATLETTFNGLIINAGSSNAEIVAARNGEASLPVRLAKVDTQLAENLTHHSFLDQLKLKFIFGAKGDKITDDALAIQNYLNFVRDNGGGIAIIPDGGYYTTATIVVPANVTLSGTSLGTTLTSSNVEIIGSLSLSPVIESNGGGGSAQTSLRNISVTRVAGTIPSGVIGVKVASTDYSSLVDVNIFRHAIPLSIEGQLSCNCERVVIYGVTDAYAVIKDIPQVTFTNCSFGRNGGELGLVATDIIRISGAADTINFIRCQLNPTVTGVANAINFKDYHGGGNGIVHFDACHIENMTKIIVSDSLTLSIPRFTMTGCTVSNAVDNPFTSLHANTSIAEWNISNCVITGTTTFTKGSILTLIGNRFSGAVHLALSVANVTGNTFNTGASLSGVWSNLVFSNNIFDGLAQTLTDTSTGVKHIFGNVSTDGYTNKNILNGDYLKIGSGISYGIKRYTGTLDGTGNISIPSEIAATHYSGLICQAFYKGGGTEMKPLTISYIDGSNIALTGGVASAKYRVTLLYSDALDAW